MKPKDKVEMKEALEPMAECVDVVEERTEAWAPGVPEGREAETERKQMYGDAYYEAQLKGE